MSEENDKEQEEELDENFVSQEEQERGAWAAREWDFEDPEVDPDAQAELEKLLAEYEGKDEDGSEE